MIIKASNGVISVNPGYVQSISLDISSGASRVQGQNSDHTTSGFVVPNREVTLRVTTYIAKNSAFIDYLKNVDWSQPVSIVGIASTTGSGLELTLTQRYNITDVIAVSQDYNAPNPGSAMTTTAVFYAQDYVVS